MLYEEFLALYVVPVGCPSSDKTKKRRYVSAMCVFYSRCSPNGPPLPTSLFLFSKHGIPAQCDSGSGRRLRAAAATTPARSGAPVSALVAPGEGVLFMNRHFDCDVTSL